MATLPKTMVTGASGFIGRHLAAKLVRSGHPVVALSRRGTAIPGAVNLTMPSYHGNALPAALQDVDTVIHLAAAAHHTDPRARGDDALFAGNLAATTALLTACHQTGVRRFVFASSVGIHGNQTRGAAWTETSPPDPADAYAWSKWRCEEQVRSLCGVGAMEYTIVRPPLVYGPGAPGNFGRLTRLAASGIPLPLGAVHNLRSLVAIDNLIDFLALCLQHPGAANQTLLVADGEDVSTTRLLQLTGQAMGRPVRLLPVPVAALRAAGYMIGQSDTVLRLCGSLQVDIAKARRVLGWKPIVDLEEGLRRALRPEALP